MKTYKRRRFPSLYEAKRMFNEYGVYIPIDDGELNVHHIVPVSMGGGDEPENLVTVCVKCHKLIHSDKKENRYADKI